MFICISRYVVGEAGYRHIADDVSYILLHISSFQASQVLMPLSKSTHPIIMGVREAQLAVRIRVFLLL